MLNIKQKLKLSFWQKPSKLPFSQVLWAILLLTGCSSSRLSNFSSISQKHPFTTSFHGLVVMDANSGKILHNTNGNKYFIPASNVKIFTLFASKKLLQQKAPALEYILKNDTIYVKGTGYPGTFHPYFEDSTAISFMKAHKTSHFFFLRRKYRGMALVGHGRILIPISLLKTTIFPYMGMY